MQDKQTANSQKFTCVIRSQLLHVLAVSLLGLTTRLNTALERGLPAILTQDSWGFCQVVTTHTGHDVVATKSAVLLANWRDFAFAISPRHFALFRHRPLIRRRGEISKLEFEPVDLNGIRS